MKALCGFSGNAKISAFFDACRNKSCSAAAPVPSNAGSAYRWVNSLKVVVPGPVAARDSASRPNEAPAAAAPPVLSNVLPNSVCEFRSTRPRGARPMGCSGELTIVGCFDARAREGRDSARLHLRDWWQVSIHASARYLCEIVRSALRDPAQLRVEGHDDAPFCFDVA